MSPRRYADRTNVGVMKSRTEIDRILRNWKADSVHWSDEFTGPVCHTLRFVWKYKEATLTARFTMKMDIERLNRESIDGRTGKVSPAKLEKSRTQWSMEAHRTLAIMLKGIFNAVDLGIIKMESVFMPFLEDSKGNVLGDVITKRITEIPGLNAKFLLTDRSSASEKGGNE